jgi:hypothetical protein
MHQEDQMVLTLLSGPNNMTRGGEEVTILGYATGQAFFLCFLF